MQKIPVSFKNKNKLYQGTLQQVFGPGANVRHLMINNYYRGSLSYTNKWLFHNPKEEMKELAEFFGEYVSKSCEQKSF